MEIAEEMTSCMPFDPPLLLGNPFHGSLHGGFDGSDAEDGDRPGAAGEGEVVVGARRPLCYSCKHCGRRFASGCGLGGHMRIHNPSFSHDTAPLLPDDRSVSVSRLSSVEVDSPTKSDSHRPLYSLRRNPKRSRRVADHEFGLFWNGYESGDLGFQSSPLPELSSGRESSSSKAFSGHGRSHGYRCIKDCLSEGGKRDEAPMMDTSLFASHSSLDAGTGSDGGWAVCQQIIPASMPGRQKDLLGRVRRKRSARRVVRSLQVGGRWWSKARSTATVNMPEVADDMAANHVVDDDITANPVAADDTVGDDVADNDVVGDDMAESAVAKDASVDDDAEADDMAGVDVAANDQAEDGMMDDDVGGDDVADRLVMLACAGSILEEESSRWGQSGLFSEKYFSPDGDEEEEDGKLARPVRRTRRRKEDQAVDMDRKRRIHECTICFRLFPTGQALGGHKRCHWTALEAKLAEPANTNTTMATPSGTILFDLNLPAPMDNSAFDMAIPPPYITQLVDGKRESEMRQWSIEVDSTREAIKISPELSRFFKCSLCDSDFDSFEAWTKHQKTHAPSFIPVFPGLTPISA